MKGKLFLLAAAILSIAACQKEETKNNNQVTGPVTIKFTGSVLDTKTYFTPSEGTVLSTLWKKNDRLGLSGDWSMPVSADVTPSSDGKTVTFSSYFKAGAKEYCAFSPYSSYTMGTEMDSATKTLKLKVPAEQSPAKGTVDPKVQLLYAYATPEADAEEVKMTFKHALAYGKIHLSNFDLKGAQINSISISTETALAGTSKLAFDTGKLTAVEPESTILLRPGELNNDIMFACLPADLSGKEISLRVTTSSGDLESSIDYASSNFKFEAGKVAVLDFDMTGSKSLKLNWVYISSKDGGTFAPQCPAIDKNGNVYFTLRYTTNLYKLNPDGTLAWKTPLGVGGTQYSSASVEPDGSAVYAGGGSNKAALMKKINGADGAVEWNFGPEDFFSSSADNIHTPNLYRLAPAIGQNAIFVDNTGTTGSVVSISKETGKRIAYVSNADGSNAPSGGVGEPGSAISKAGTIGSVMKKGHYAFNLTEMENPTNKHSVFGGYVPFGFHYGTIDYSQFNSGIAATTINGKNAFAYFLVEKSGTTYKGHIIATEASLGLGMTAPSGVSDKALIYYTIDNMASIGSEGSIVVGDNLELIVSLRNNSGNTEGGILAVGQDGQLAYKFVNNRLDVNGGAAVDNQGLIHFVNNTNGDYYILKPNYSTKTCDVKSVVNLYSLLEEFGTDLTQYKGIEGWTTVMIGYDGKIYLGVNLIKDAASGKHAAVLCLEYKGTTSPSVNSPWPMRYADCSHTGRQK